MSGAAFHTYIDAIGEALASQISTACTTPLGLQFCGQMDLRSQPSMGGTGLPAVLLRFRRYDRIGWVQGQQIELHYHYRAAYVRAQAETDNTARVLDQAMDAIGSAVGALSFMAQAISNTPGLTVRHVYCDAADADNADNEALRILEIGMSVGWIDITVEAYHALA